MPTTGFTRQPKRPDTYEKITGASIFILGTYLDPP
jgi:hypothetical protein